MTSAGFNLRARAATVRMRLADDRGFGLLEVLVSALIVFLVSLAVFSALDAAGRTADNNRSRSVASSLAQSDQERMRSLAVTALSNLDSTRTVTVDSESFTVRSQASFVSGPADATNCTSTSDQAPRYLKMTSTVSWSAMRGTSPVQMDSLRAITNGSISGLGTLAIGVQDQAGAGVPGVAFTLSGPASRSGTTNASGCLTFGYIPAGTYSVSGSKTGFVTSGNPTQTTISDTSVVSADDTATESYQYDQAGGVTANYVAHTYGNTTATAASNSTGFTIANSSMGSLPMKTFAHTSAATYSTGLVNFPFASPSSYRAWAGTCAENEPDATVNATMPAQTVLVGRGTSTAVTLRQPRLRVQVQRRASNGNYVYFGSGTVKIKPTTVGCTQTVTATLLSNTGSASGSTTASANYSTYEAILPFGTDYTVCAAYSGGGGNAMTGVTNRVYTGSQWPTTLTVPYSTTQYTSC